MPSRVDSRRKLGREVRIRRVDVFVIAVSSVHVGCVLLDIRTTHDDN